MILSIGLDESRTLSEMLSQSPRADTSNQKSIKKLLVIVKGIKKKDSKKKLEPWDVF